MLPHGLTLRVVSVQRWEALTMRRRQRDLIASASTLDYHISHWPYHPTPLEDSYSGGSTGGRYHPHNKILYYSQDKQQ
jgi:hypothetical protein